VREISLHDTRSGTMVPLRPRDPGHVGIYACGPTVYGRVHVGNARPFVVFALLKRFLVHEGLRVTLVENITDVNDKIYAAARAVGRPSAQLAQEMTRAYVADTDALGLGRPDHEPRATETIARIVELIGALIDAEHAYAVGGDVYFRVRTYPPYGALSHRNIGTMEPSDEGEGLTRKEDPLDFALWKARKEGEDTWWPAPWGEGRPGWHIECSAMAEGLLGLGFDIHGGGVDLVFPHHENEAAQTAAARGEPLARIWMHNGMVRMDERKMAKSEGNIATLHHALAEHGRDTLLMYFCQGRYRQPIAFSDERLDEAAAAVGRVREAARRVVPGPGPPELAPLRERFFAALAEDFNTPTALGALFDWVRAANRQRAPVGDADLRAMLWVLGLDGLLASDAAERVDPRVRALVAERERARAQRDFPRADAVREQVRALGWEVRDSPSGPELVPAPD
jgi:cysteinyl-tRNA synthetase